MQINLMWDWKVGIAMGELVGSSILVFLFFAINHLFSKRNDAWSKPLGFVLATVFSIGCGWAVGSMISGDGFGLAMITPVSAISSAFIAHTYNALWFILLFQFLGSILGWGMFKLYALALKPEERGSDNIVTPSIKERTIISSIFQLLLVSALIFIPTIDYVSYGTSAIWNLVILAFALLVIFVLTQRFGFLLFSPWITLTMLLEKGLKKEITKELLITIAIDLLFQILYTTLITLVVVYAKIGRGIY